MAQTSVTDEQAVTVAPWLASSVGARLMGAAVGAIVAINLLPFPYSLVFLLLPLLFGLWFLAALSFRDDFRGIVASTATWLDPFVIAIAAVCLAIGLGFARSTEPFRSLTYFEFGAGLGCMLLGAMTAVVFAAGGSRRGAIEACYLFVVAAAAFFGAVALYKYYLLETDRALTLIPHEAPDFYPWGTSLRTDYNLFSIPFLVAALASFRYALRARGLEVSRFAALAILGSLFIFIGINSGSRRFAILIGFCFLATLFFDLLETNGNRVAKAVRAAAFGLCVVLCVVSVAPVVQFLAAQYEAAQEAREQGSSSIIQKAPNVIELNTQARLETIIEAVLVREAYWRGAVELLRGSNFLLGNGFDYQKKLSCMIHKCVGFDHPHNFVLAHSLFAGIFGLASVVCLLGLVLMTVSRNVWLGTPGERILCITTLAIFAYAFVSGDTVFALPALIALPALLPRWSWVRLGRREAWQ